MRQIVDGRRLALLAPIAAIVVGGLALAGLFTQESRGSGETGGMSAAELLAASSTAGPVEAKEGAFAPDFEASTLDGQRVRLSDYHGKPIVLNFWGTSCVSCLSEIPNLEKVWKEQASRGLIVLGVNVGDDRERALAFFEKLGATYPSILDRSQVLARAYRAPGLPVTVFIGRDGRIERIIVGEINYTVFDRFARLVLGDKDIADLDDPLPLRFVSPLPPVE